MRILADCVEAARANLRRVVMPEGGEPRIREAAARLAGEGLAVPVLIGAEVPGCETVDPAGDPRMGELAALVAARRERMTAQMAARLLAKPLYFGGALVAAGHAAAMVAGAANPTRRVIEAGMMTVGPATGVAVPSSFFLMLLGERALVFADCALNVDPSVEELADIAVASGRSAERLLGEARAAMLSYSTLGSGAGASVEKVRAAVALARETAPDLAIDGEFQADTALNAGIAAKKGAGGDVAGQANVLVFPDLNAGNIAYKLAQELAGAQAVGPFLQGFARPVSDLSRGATVEDVVAAAVVTLALG